MDKFHYLAPTEVFFGKNGEEQVGELCKRYGAHKVLVHFGGKSATKSGLLDRVTDSLTAAGLAYVKLGGVVPNPELGLVRKGIDLCKQEGVDFILAVGGGSVIDSAKGIGYGLANPGDVWDYYLKKATVTGCAPLACVLTLAATGSEMSTSSVITNEDGGYKRGLTSNYCFCKFAILNPELTYTLPAYQTASGSTDIIMHTLERYFMAPSTQPLELIDTIAEGLIRTVIKYVPIALADPTNYEARANLMWSGTVSHNDMTGERTSGDWSCHQLEHELSGMFGVAHGAGLAAIWGTWARYVMHANVERFAQLAVNVFWVPAFDPVYKYRSARDVAIDGIEHMEAFFKSIGMPTSIHELIGRKLTEEEIALLAYKCSFEGTRQLGNFKKLSQEDMAEIYRRAN